MKSRMLCRLWAIVALLALLPLTTLAQQIAIRGHVKDAKGEPVIGATVVVKGTTTGQNTDINGNFAFSAPKSGVLRISFVGFVTQEVPVASNLTITLKEDAKTLDDVVVIGYGQVKKNDVTGSVMAIDASKLTKGSATSASDLLVGKAAGVSVVTDGGAPGSGATIRIRGGSSMSASNDPLIVIDGVPVDNNGINGMANPLATVHPNDIETFTILKDASATAIYGSRASNGVIIITTKKGKSGAVKVSYSGTVSVSARPAGIQVMDVEQFRNFVQEKFGNGSLHVAALGQYATDWQKEIFRTSVSTDHNISVSGAVPHMPYRASVAYTNENGVLKTSNLQRVTGSLSLNPNFFDKKLNIQLNVKGVYNTNRFADQGAIGSASIFDPTQPIRQGDSYFMYRTQDATATPIGIAPTNPVSLLEQKTDKSTVYRSIGNAQVDYRFHFLPELRANLNLGYDISKSDGSIMIDDNSPISYTQGTFKTGFGENRRYSQNKRNTLLDFYFNYNNTFGIHALDVMAGYSWQRFYFDTENLYPYSEAMATENGKEYYQDGDDFKSESYLVSFFGRLNYTLLDRYLLTFTLRNDGSSRFKNHWGLFPSVALAWKVKDDFFKDVQALSDLKLRLGYGVTGQQNLGNGDYPYMARYIYSKAGANYFFGNTRHSLIAPLAYDENLKWEQTATANIGLDFGFLRNRITGTIDFYKRKTSDLLNIAPIPAGTNFSNEVLTNVGTLENTGVEFSINAHAINTKDWHWTLGYNISYNKNKIVKLTANDNPNYPGVIHGGIEGGTGTQVLIHKIGKPFNSFYVFEQQYNADGKPIEGQYVDQNNDNKIDENDLITYKKVAPDVFMGFTSQLSYKNWDFSFALRASLGNYVYNNIQSLREPYGGSNLLDPTGFLRNRMTSAPETNFEQSQFRSSYYVQNASFLRMDNISLGYTFDKLFRKGQTARIYATVQNPFVITQYKGLDPEISGEGIDRNIYPRPRIFMLGLNLNF